MSGPARVTVVLSYHLRPDNYRAQLAAFRGQTVPVRLAVFHTTKNPAPPRWDADFVVSHSGLPNPGSSGRWAAALLARTEYVLVHDDDWLPSNNYLERLLATADLLNGAFGVLGEFGRRAGWEGRVPFYDGRLVGGASTVTVVTNVVRSYFFRPHTVGHGARFLDEFAPDIPGVHEDLAICLGNLVYGGLPTYLPPLSEDSGQNVELSAPHALARRAAHKAERTTILRRVAERGLLTPDR